MNIIEVFQSFTTQEQAIEHLEKVRWHGSPNCPYCGSVSVGRHASPDRKMARWQCRDCNRAFAVTVGTMFHGTHIPLRDWFLVLALMLAAKKSASSYQIARDIGKRRATVWSMMHRIRTAMAADPAQERLLHGIVEADETYVGGKDKNKHRNKRHGIGGGFGKEIVFALVERQGKVQSHHVPTVSAKTLRPILTSQIAKASATMSDDGGARIGREFPNHQTVNHSIGEYVRGPVHTNTIEGYFSILKRGIIGTYHHVSPQHLKRYLAEFDFRYNTRMALGVNDAARADRLVRGIVGKRLMYRDSSPATA